MQTRISRTLTVLLLATLNIALRAAATDEAPLDTRLNTDAGFAVPPKVERVGDRWRITFAVSAATDAEVAVLDAKGNVIRHLAAGLLGKNAPAPFRRDALAQAVVWDGKDDLGQAAAGAPFRARMSVGLRPKLEKIVGWDGNTLGGSIVGLAAGKEGEVFVLLSDSGRSEVRVLDKDGKYRRTIMPYASNTPHERTHSVGHLEIEGERLPIVFNGHSQNLSPLTAGMKKQTMTMSPRGHLILASAVGTMAEHGLPRHLLALHPQGGAPTNTSFVGPQLLAPRNFLGGAGESGSPYFDHVAASPDGERVYVTMSGESWAFKQRHGVFRVKWSDKEKGSPFLGKDEPGNDDAHFNDPQGLAVDKDGNIYVCDRGNGRLMVFSAEGKLLGKVSVPSPEQIAVHPQSGVLYVVSRQKSGAWVDTSKMSQKEVDEWKRKQAELKKLPPPLAFVFKLSAWGKEPPVELARLQTTVEVMALDAAAEPPRLWAATSAGLVTIADQGDKLEVGQPVNNTKGLSYPWFVAADPVRPRVLVRELLTGLKNKPIRAVDLETGVKTSFLQATEAAFDRAGNIYGMGGWGSNAMYLFDPDGKPLNLPSSDSNKIDTGPWTSYGPDQGLHGHCVAPNGDIYLVRAFNHWGWGEKGVHSRVDVFGPDGKKKRLALVDGLGDGDCGIGVDAAGNVYLGSNVKPADKPFPASFMGKVPAEGWVWWRKETREPPWCYPYYNSYLFHWGSVLKFGPGGGALYGMGLVAKTKDAPLDTSPSPLTAVSNAPAEAVTYATGYLDRKVKVVGALWRYGGMGTVPTSMASANWGDPACGCHNSRLAVDEYGRVFVPDVFRFSIEVLDSNGNQIDRIGRYGNADSAGPGSPVPEPEIAFAWPGFVSVAGGRAFVSDPVNRRVSVIRFEHAAEEVREIP